MDNKYLIGIIIALILIIVAGIFALAPNNAKEDCKLEILTNNQLAVGDDLEVQLTDLNNAAIANEVVKIEVNNESYHATTNNDGKVILKTDNFTSGEYAVKVTFEGSDKYNANSTSQNLILKGDNVTETDSSAETQQTYAVQSSSESSSSSDSSDGIHYDSELNVYYNDEGKVVDPDGQHSMEVGSNYQDLVERGKHIAEDGLE